MPLPVSVVGDTNVEADETFTINLTSISSTYASVTIGDDQGIGTILNDELATLSINDVTVTEGNIGTVNAVFSVNLSAASTVPVTVNYSTANDTATVADTDYTLTSGTLTFPANSTAPQTITVPVKGDLTVELNEQFFVNLSGAAGATILDNQGVGKITNDDSATLSVNDVTVTEGNTGGTNAVFTLTLSNPVSTMISGTANMTDGTATSTNSDYQNLPIPFSFSPGEVTKTISVAVNGDTNVEANETFSVILAVMTSPPVPDFTIADGEGIGTIINDDFATITVSDATVTEGNSGTVNATFIVSLNLPGTPALPLDQPVIINYATANDSATTANSDYVAKSGTITFPAFSTTAQTITVVVNGDTTVEANETFNINLTPNSLPYTAITISDPQGVGTITNDDTATLAINQSTVTEGNSGAVNAVFTVTLSNPSATAITVDYTTANDTATVADGDYSLTSGTLTFPANSTASQTITVPVNGDLKVEPNETFFVNLSNPIGAGMTTAQGVGTITNDDTATLSINDVTVTEGNSGTVKAIFTVTLSNPISSNVMVQYETASNTAIAPIDFVAIVPMRTLTFTPGGALTQTFTVFVNGDNTVEDNETFYVNLSTPTGATISDAQGLGTITNDDAGTLNINDVTITEGNSGIVNAVFTVSLSQPSALTVTVQYQTANNTAAAPGDYTALPTTTLTFNPGDQTKTISVAVKGEAVIEFTETFFVNLSNATNATIADTQGLGSITNDDFPAIAINDVIVTEGNSGTVNAIFAVTLSEASPETVTVIYATTNGTAAAGSDFTSANGTLTFAPGELSKSISVGIQGETNIEPDETFFVNLSNPVNATIADGQGLGTIKDDDFIKQLSVNLSDPIICSGEGNTLNVHAEIANPNSSPANFTFEATLPPQLSGVVGTCVVLGGSCTVNSGSVVVTGTLAATQIITIDYKVLVAPNTPPGNDLCISSKGMLNGNLMATVVACAKLTCPTIAKVGVSDQKTGSVLVFPYYTSGSASPKETKLSLSNIGDTEAIAHLFFIDGANCNQADFFVCLTPNAKITFNASEYDPETTGWVMAVAVNRDGVPVQNNVLIGNAFVRDGMYVDNYGAESFWAHLASVAAINGEKATLFFDGGGYDAIPRELTAEIQSPLDAIGQKIVTVGMRGDLTESGLTGAGQTGVGVAYNAQERAVSFSNFLSGNCFATATISTTSPRVPGTMNGLIGRGNSGTLRFTIGGGVGLLMTPKNAKWSGIRGLHKTKLTTSQMIIPILKPHC